MLPISSTLSCTLNDAFNSPNKCLRTFSPALVIRPIKWAYEAPVSRPKSSGDSWSVFEFKRLVISRREHVVTIVSLGPLSSEMGCDLEFLSETSDYEVRKTNENCHNRERKVEKCFAPQNKRLYILVSKTINVCYLFFSFTLHTFYITIILYLRSIIFHIAFVIAE